MAELKIPKAWQSWRTIKPNDPKRLHKLIEAGIKLRNQRKSLEAEAAVYGSEENELKKFVIDNFKKNELTEVHTKAGTAKLVPKSIFQMDKANGGWDAIWAYIKAEDAYDLLEKRIHQGAAKGRWAAGVKIPGVQEFVTWVLKLGDAE